MFGTVQNHISRAKIPPWDQNIIFSAGIGFSGGEETKHSSFLGIRRSCRVRRTIIKAGITHNVDLKHLGTPGTALGTPGSGPKVSGTKISFIFLYLPSDPSWENQLQKPSVHDSLNFSKKPDIFEIKKCFCSNFFVFQNYALRF